MYGVLIVDDELPIRQELQLYSFEALQCEIRGLAENGSRALDFLKSNPVDIVITDIRMPVMDGLQLIERAKSLFPAMQFILLSCINDFEAIQTALKMGVVDYILKGAYSDDELALAISKAISNIEERKISMIEHLKDEYLKTSRLLAKLVHMDEAIPEASLVRLRELKAIGDYPFSAVWIDFLANREESVILTDELRDEYLSCPEFMVGITAFFLHPGGCLLFLDHACEQGSELFRAFEENRGLLDSLYRRAKGDRVAGALRKSYFLPSPMRTGSELRAFLSGLDGLHDRGFYLEPESICENPPARGSLRGIDTESIRKRFASIPIEEISRFLDVELRASLMGIRAGRDELFDFASGLIEEYPACRLSETKGKEAVARIRASGSFDDMIDGMMAYFSKLRSEKKLNKYIARAIVFIDQDLARPLSLSIVAEEIGLSASYLSSLFFRETAKQFNEYVTEKRMQRAASLLRESSHKVYEVSEMVGIPSYRYFSRLFKEYTGQKPSDFK